MENEVIESRKRYDSAWANAEKAYKALADHERLCEICRDFNSHHKRCEEGKKLFESSVAALDKAQNIT